MPKKQPLYPHVPKGRQKKGANAWRCSQCGWTTWNVIYCPKCGSRDLVELTSEEVQQFYRTGKPVIHPRSELPSAKAKPAIWPPFQAFLDDLQKAIHDEMDAYNMYRGMATTASALGLGKWATTLEQIANDENRHHIRLEELLKEVERKRQELYPSTGG